MIELDKMRTGLAEGEFFLEYQPIISLADGRCIGAEALIRWRRESGIVPPDDFIPLAENTPLSGLITYWVIDTIGEELGDWLRANPDAHISINVPPEILGRGGMEYAASKSGLLDLASQLILEITERGVPDPMGVEALNNIWGMKVRIALDDVTLVGGANLAILSRCNFSVIKLDKTLVAQIDPSCPAPDWLEGITAMLRTSRIVVIAEGVETEQQLMTLRESGIQAAQGFYFSRPIPAAAFMDYRLKTQRSVPNPMPRLDWLALAIN